MTTAPTCRRTAAWLIAVAAPGVAGAQGLPIPFLPHGYAGVEAGRAIRTTGDFTGDRRLGGDDTAVDYGAFAGIELPALPFGYLALEAGVGGSDATTRATSGTGAAAVVTRGRAGTHWSGTARVGINAVPGLAAYGIAGYGAERVDVTQSHALTGTVLDTDRCTLDGLVYGVGARYTFGRFLGARLEYRRQTTGGRYDPERLMGGVYFRL